VRMSLCETVMKQWIGRIDPKHSLLVPQDLKEALRTEGMQTPSSQAFQHCSKHLKRGSDSGGRDSENVFPV
jgi:hypothetical protein